VIYYTKGPITGTQRVSIRGNLLEVEWDVAFHGLSELLSRLREGGIRTATHQALERLVGTGDSID